MMYLNYGSGGFSIRNSSSITKMFMDNAGNVGIGTPIPAYPLDISADVTLPLRITGNTNPGLMVANAGTTKFVLGIPTQANNFIANSSVNDVALRASGGKLLFSTSAAGTTNDLTVSSGSVGIGTTSPGAKLDVYGSARYGYNFASMPIPFYGGIQIGEYGAGGAGELQFLSTTSGAGYGFRFRGSSANGALLLERRWNSGTFLPDSAFMSFTDQGVGIGTNAATALLEIEKANQTAPSPARFSDMMLVNGTPGVLLDMTANSEIHVAGLRIGNAAVPVIDTMTGAAGQSPLRLNPTSDNDVLIGSSDHARGLKVQGTGPSTFAGSVTVTGSLTAGTVYATYQDVAEWVPAAEAMPAGTVVVISHDSNNTVTVSTRSYDTGVAGVVSANPGLLLGVASTSKGKIATTGRVRVRVDASRQPIRMGDLLVTSDRPGMAMKSEPLDVGGVKIHRPGTILGKALEPLPNGEGDILVLLSLQ